MKKEELRIKDIDKRLSDLRHKLEVLIPIWNQIDRRVSSIQGEIKYLEDEKMKLSEGQMTFDGTFDF